MNEHIFEEYKRQTHYIPPKPISFIVETPVKVVAQFKDIPDGAYFNTNNPRWIGLFRKESEEQFTAITEYILDHRNKTPQNPFGTITPIIELYSRADIAIGTEYYVVELQ